ncbi:DNA cytosine methyltransferase [Roseibacillus ishigakijimensis]|uniref:Cytosine-specific methyltransferase n=1 Tax=Roseibacillus ishigakijimensis TaxID=454146 RepID=A0A934RNR9_9BACT|nr:DNA cytosine methyltransferase [Roseibacillus ishigakijimensis]MBK1833037.1 DNA cytosine methyltransferase [Roseibacillus ishigakijimensis]
MILTSIEICAGGGGQALGLEQAGFEAQALVELDGPSCATLRHNRPQWKVFEGDVRHFEATAYDGVDLFAGGVPCPPFSIAGKQLGKDDERDLFPEALRLIKQCHPKAVMLENVRGFLASNFDEYRAHLKGKLSRMGYRTDWQLLNASDFGVSQLRPRVVIVALRKDIAPHFQWPLGLNKLPPTVGEALYDLMAQDGWKGANAWKKQANAIAPTLVGGSKKHGGADLGPTRARNAWAKLGVNGKSLGDASPERDFEGMPRLTIPMTARIQGFPDNWKFMGKKTAAYRQIGNAFPPPVARAVAEQLKAAIVTAQTQEKTKAA